MNLYTTALGEYSASLPLGTYSVEVRKPYFVSERIDDILVTENQVSDIPNLVLRAGDINNDNRIDLEDMVIVARNYGKAGN